MRMTVEVCEERLSKIMAERLASEASQLPIPKHVVSLHEAGFLPSQIAHRTGLSRSDIDRFVKRLPPIECRRYRA